LISAEGNRAVCNNKGYSDTLKFTATEAVKTARPPVMSGVARSARRDRRISQRPVHLPRSKPLTVTAKSHSCPVIVVFRAEFDHEGAAEI